MKSIGTQLKILALAVVVAASFSFPAPASARASCTDGGNRHVSRCVKKFSMWVICTAFYDCAK